MKATKHISLRLRARRLRPALSLTALCVALLAPGCRKETRLSSDRDVAVFFRAPEVESKAVTNSYMPPGYNTDEAFVVYALYHAKKNVFTGEPYMEGVTCKYEEGYDAWIPGKRADGSAYLWPAAGYLSFHAYSPADAVVTVSHDWTDGFTFTGFKVPDAGKQYDLLYSDVAANCERSDYVAGFPYDDDDDAIYRHNGINLRFHHALCLIEIQAYSGLGRASSRRFYIQSIVLEGLHDKGTFSSGSWSGQSGDVNYTLLDLGEGWKELESRQATRRSAHPDVVPMLLPQDLGDRVTLKIRYKDNEGREDTVSAPLTGSWEPGKKYTYQLIFSDVIEFGDITIEPWGEPTTGEYWIIK